MTTSSFQRQFSRFYAQELKRGFDSTSGDSFLLFFGRTVPFGQTFAGPPTTGSDTSPPSNSNSIGERFGAWRNAIGGKLMEPRNVYHVFPRKDWVHGTVYHEYDDSVDIFDDDYDFYVLTDEMNVYKCISNAGGSRSLEKPEGTLPTIISCNDGYKWKFIFKVTEDSKKFLNLEYIPCQYVTQREENETLPQFNVQVTAVDGAINHIGITGSNGAWWNQTTLQSDTKCFVRGPSSEDIEEVNDALDLSLTSDDFNNMNSYWIAVNWPSETVLDDLPDWGSDDTGYSIFFHGGRGPEIGQLRQINTSISRTTGALLKLDTPLGATLSTTGTGQNITKYTINPHAVVNGDGEDATIRLVCDSSGEITEVKIVNPGSNYRNASVSIKTGAPEMNGTPPTLRPFISPIGGHGANPIVDFNASRLMVVMEMDGEEGGDFIIGDDFRQFGLIKNPIISSGGASGGGEFVGSVAGSEFSKTQFYTIVPLQSNDIPLNFDQESDSVTFKSGDYVYGKESRATARIKSWIKKVGHGADAFTGILEVDRMSGEFSIPTGDTHSVRYIFTGNPEGGAESTIITGSPVWQYADGTDEFPTAKGTVESYNKEYNELVVKLRSGSFGETGDIFINRFETNETSFEDDNISFLETAGGEPLKSFSVDSSTGAITFRTYTDTNTETQDAARAKHTSEIISLYDRIPTYDLTHRLIINDEEDDLSIGTFYAGQNIRQTRTNGTITSGTVSKWKMTSGTTGEMVVSNVLNSFEDVLNNQNGSFSVVGDATLGNGKTIVDVQIPELVIGSGEVLYIQNMRPITRSFEQQEEFKILLGF